MLEEQQLILYWNQHIEQLEGNKKARGWFKEKPGGLTLEDAKQMITQDERKAHDSYEKKEQRMIDRIWRQDRDEVHRKGVEARAAEHTYKKQL
jgi:hypothetical protein